MEIIRVRASERHIRIIASLSATCVLALNGPIAVAQNKNGFDYSEASVPVGQIHWGGVPRDGIPSIERPKFLAAAEAKSVRKSDRVLGVFRNGVAKAYPIRILERHEVVNDQFGADAVVVTYCPLCFSGMSFLVDSQTTKLTFGVSGLLYNSDVLLYDRQTGSLWSQIMSQAISGPLKGVKLEAVATAHTSWHEWSERHPDTLVLSRDTGYRINYRDYHYRDYKQSRQLMFPVANKSNQYSNKELVLGVTVGDNFKAYPFKELRKNGATTFEDSIAGTKLTIEWNKKEAYARVLTADGEELPTVIVYWFAWYAFHPNTVLFQAGSG
jgi:hypothetical protein